MEKPNPPKARVINENCSVFCFICNSTMTRLNFWNPFSERTCDNKECENSFARQKKLQDPTISDVKNAITNQLENSGYKIIKFQIDGCKINVLAELK